jgi:hypothetical protein
VPAFAYNMASFSYAPLSLNESSLEIRLVTLEPGPQDAEIKCELHPAFLNKAPPYEALSYTWGNPNDLRPISLCGSPWRVTANLERALRHLRHEDKARTLWIDALCINQEDFEEKEVIVPEMRKIYSTADKVLAWIGAPGHDSEVALPIIQQIVTSFLQSDLKESDLEAASVVGFTAPHLRLTVWTFLSRPYWRRIWVVQELEACGFMPQDKGIIVSGFHSVSRWTLGLFMTFLMATARTPSFPAGLLPTEEPERSVVLKRLPPAYEMFGALLQFRNYHRRETPRRPELWKLMFITRTFLASDIRDKLYALLGVADDAWRPMDISANYKESPELVFTEFTKSLIASSRSLICLLYNRMGSNGFGPSWVPDVNLVHTIFYGTAWIDEHGRYKAAGGEEFRVEFDKRGLLIAAGVKIGVMERVIGPLGERLEPLVAEENLREYVRPVGLFRSSTEKEIMEFGWSLSLGELETFWRTLVMDGDWIGWDDPVCPAPPRLQEAARVLFHSTAAELEETRKLSNVAKLIVNIVHCTTHRCFFTTSSGRMGLGPYHAKPDDIVAALFGASRFVVLRPKEACYELVGDAYIQGGMFGELVNNNTADVESFSIC